MSDPIQHHYVPQFMLRDFGCQPLGRQPRIHVFDKQTGKSFRQPVNKVACQRGFYDALGHDGEPLPVEGTIEQIETAAAPLIRQLAEGGPLPEGEEELAVLATFVGLAWMRTPRHRDTMNQMLSSLEAEQLGMLLDHPEAYRRRADEVGLSDRKTEDEIEAERLKLLDEVQSGDVLLSMPQTNLVGLTFSGLAEIAPMIAEHKRWSVIHASAPDAFILSDHPVYVFDPMAGGLMGAGMFSSPKVEVTLPISPSACLFLHHDDDAPLHQRTIPKVVDQINVRTASLATRWLYGPSEARLRRVIVRDPLLHRPGKLGEASGLHYAPPLKKTEDSYRNLVRSDLRRDRNTHPAEEAK